MKFLTEDLWFPNVSEASEDGILAIGGDLSVARLLLAYRSGIFPWFETDEPILWWSPDPRFVLFPKKLKVSKNEYKKSLIDHWGFSRVVDYYGMIEQVGSIFFECQHGCFHPSDYSRVLIRDPNSFELSTDGQPGLIQLISTLPTSYPGFSILTEDIGVIREGACRCGSDFPGFTVLGRHQRSEIRGCSDASGY